MTYDYSKADEAVLALLYLNLYEAPVESRAWKSLPWECLDRLFERGLIANPRTKAKSVAVTAEGVAACKDAFSRHFGAT